jgi:putative phosphoesterase
MIGVISDTHGLLRPEAIEALRGSELIIHAGDVGDPEILDHLRELAPVVAIRGNVDYGNWAKALPSTANVGFEGHTIHVRHILDEVMPVPAGVSAIVYGHSHKPSIENRNGVLYLNPGSAGPRRFRLPVTIAHMSVIKGKLTARVIELSASPR